MGEGRADNGVDKLQVNGSISSGTISAIDANLDTLKTLTKTYCVTSLSSNIPVNDYGYLEVIVHGIDTWVMQRFTTFGITNTEGRVFVRCLVGGIWSAWSEK